MSDEDFKVLNREIFLSFWKIHILHHAAEGPVVGQWMLEELRHHGYVVSPGTLYPMLKRMESYGWLRSKVASDSPKAARSYFLTAKGKRVLKRIRTQMRELNLEVPSH